MRKYPFDPLTLAELPQELELLFRDLEMTLLEEICSRLKIADQLNEVTVQDIRALRSHGIDPKEIKKAIRETTGISEKKLNELLDDVVKRNQEYYTELIDAAKVTQPEYIVSEKDIDAIKRQTLEEFTNVTRTMAFLVDNGRTALPPAKAFQWACDSALMQVQSGAISYNQAVANAVKQLADSGLGIVTYESGHKDQVDVAVRRAVMTGVSQVCVKYTEQTAELLDSPYYEISAHAGARDTGIGWQNHKDWQGKVYSVRTGDIYPNIYAVCGLGEVDGLEGANCRHIRSVWVEGVSERTYTDEQLANIDKPPFEYEERKYTTYQATQMQRRIENTVRKLERNKAGYDAAGNEENARAANIKIRRLKSKYHEFSEAAGLREQPERMKVYISKEKMQMYQRELKDSQLYKNVERGTNENFVTLRGVNIDADKIVTYSDAVYVSKNATIKPKALHQIKVNTDNALKEYGVPDDFKPKIVIVSNEEMPTAYGTYDARTNTVYYVPIVADKKNKALADELANVERHEMWHCKQAHDYISNGGSITEETYKKYIIELNKKCKKRVESLGVTEYNVKTISKYAESSLWRGRYDEIEAEIAVKGWQNR